LLKLIPLNINFALPKTKHMPIIKATLADVPELNVLINSAYRGEESKKAGQPKLI
jgi:hypothetical protein